MLAVFGIALLIVALIVHEAGHAITMMRRGIQIKQAGIGLSALSVKLHPRFLPFPVTISPLLVGAYVEPTAGGAKQLENLPYEDQAVCVGAGVITNFIFGGVLGVIFCTGALVSPGYRHGLTLIMLIVSIVITIVPILFMHQICKLMPALGTLALGGMIYLVIQSLDNVAGPVGVARMATGGTSWLDTVLIGAVLSISLALANMIPLMPLDGGRVMLAFMKSRKLQFLSNAYSQVTMFVFVFACLAAVAHDLKLL